MVFRRDNKVDSFQRQMSALRNQLGNTNVNDEDEMVDDMPELDDEQFGAEPYRSSAADIDRDSGAYSFGSYPGQGQGAVSERDELSPAVPEMPAADSGASVVANDTSWKGDLSTETSVQVFGKVEGSITAREDIWIAEGAEVNATLNAQRIIVAGTVAGAIVASSRFEALPTSRITADVSSPTSVVHEGATINGNFKVGSGTSSEAHSERSSTSVIQRRTRPAS